MHVRIFQGVNTAFRNAANTNAPRNRKERKKKASRSNSFPIELDYFLRVPLMAARYFVVLVLIPEYDAARCFSDSRYSSGLDVRKPGQNGPAKRNRGEDFEARKQSLILSLIRTINSISFGVKAAEEAEIMNESGQDGWRLAAVPFCPGVPFHRSLALYIALVNGKVLRVLKSKSFFTSKRRFSECS